jgi:hypothetical protein
MGKALSRTVKCSKVRISVSKVSKVSGGEIFKVNVVNIVNVLAGTYGAQGAEVRFGKDTEASCATFEI